jgi:hypothetical protein
MKKKERIEFLEQYEKNANDLFGKVNYQTLKFLIMENIYEVPNSPDFLPIEKSVMKFLSWQNKPIPKDVNIKLKYEFNHDDDLSWNDCINACQKYRDMKSEARKKYEEISISEQYKDSMDDPMVEALLMMEKIRNEKQ